ncbi:PriCT-2 domain-containing protein [Propionivibrio sp.]|uniref:PriCT-2 domain-containing protein n=1 Tax=Propionivibrio sp. TaxID=2212460 RepID=UPI0039E3BBCA
MSDPRLVTEYDKAHEALKYADPNCDRLTWVRIATALKGAFEEKVGFELFDTWSKGGDKYDMYATRDTWKSVKPGSGVSLGSLYHEAKKGGFRPYEWQTQAAPVRVDDGQRAAERAAALAAEAKEEARRYAEVAQKAVELFKKARQVAADHPYIVRKGLRDHPWLQAEAVAPREMDAADLARHLGYKPKAKGVPLAGRVLLIPMIDGRTMTTLEFIDGHGRKTALAGGLKKGAWNTPVPMGLHLAANPDTPIVVVEGWATSYSAQYAFLRPELEMPGAYVVAAGADTNLGNVARTLHAQHPDAPIVIGADVGNPDSMDYARKAAASVGGCVMTPDFPDEQFHFLQGYLGKSPTDFNDQLAYYVANRLPLDGFLKDLDYAFRHAEFPDRSEFPDLVPEAAVSHASRAISIPREAPAFTGDRTMEAEAPSTHAPTQKREPGEPLYDIKTLPDETRDAVQRIFGSRHTLYAPRENGGPYSGEVHEAPGYLIQEVGSRSLVVHDKTTLQFANDRLKWMDENQKLNGHELSVFYNDNQAKVYPYDRVRDELDRAVGSFKKSAKELGLDPQFADQLDKAFTKSMDRIQGLRKEAQAKAKESRAANTPAAPAPQAKTEQHPQPAKPTRKAKR